MDSETDRSEFDPDQTWKTNTVDLDRTWPNADRRSREELPREGDDPRA